MFNFMVKDFKKYVAMGGWGFADFQDGKANDEAMHEAAFTPRSPPKTITMYSPVTQKPEPQQKVRGNKLWLLDRPILAAGTGIRARSGWRNKFGAEDCTGRGS